VVGFIVVVAELVFNVYIWYIKLICWYQSAFWRVFAV